MEEEDHEWLRRPGLKLMPEYGVDVPVWHGPDSEEIGNVSAEALVALGVSLRSLSACAPGKRGWDHNPFTGSPLKEFWPGSPLTVGLARHLQAELPGYRIYLHTRQGRQPIEDWAD